MSILWMIGGFVLVLSPIIIIHELGHFTVAKRFGIRVEEFGLGFPPRAVKLFERDGTIYSLNWIPLGGFVRPAGEDDPDVPGGLAAASKTARFFTLSAGALFNFALAFIILWIAFLIGPPMLDDSQVAILNVVENSAAAQAGLQTDDIFVSVNGQPVAGDITFLQETVRGSNGSPLELVMERDGELLTIMATPTVTGEGEQQSAALGVSLGGVDLGQRNAMPPLAAAQESLGTMWRVVSLTVQAPAMLLSGELSPEEARPISVVGMSQIIGSQAESASTTGDWFGLLFFAGIISVALGFTNLLPLPALDGGRIMFVLLEAVRGKRIEPEREGFVHMVGMLLLLGLMVLLIVQDVINPIIPF
ncbi:MAG: M50 family metallopeptidase [Anaerolineae bacterium]|nr:M50 family metallopeptidase [Anaerolineae bacterium]MCO5188790.1 M50 family metallopeptidase [Anaerolineae bacterium]MCO5191858.1 M50 family metallopeptidase [Anaerolineae bacterium]MCO5197674.1 M50 family metallopeptidase [Anaerolineae bacterium]MCO5206601.1 M50 family metallopeptidase [Anaerolineae bacterium]